MWLYSRYGVVEFRYVMWTANDFSWLFRRRTESNYYPCFARNILRHWQRDSNAPKRKRSQSHKCNTVNRRLKRIKFAGSHDDDADIYTVERILARRKDRYLILWEGYEATTWEPSCNIIDKGMLRSFEAGFEPLDDGVEVLDARMIGEQQQYYITWQGRPKEGAEWVIGTEISQDCISRDQKSLDKNAE